MTAICVRHEKAALSSGCKPHLAERGVAVSYEKALVCYRPGRNAQQAVAKVQEQLFRGHPDVVDADLADYFGSIPHADLLKSVARRIVDRRVLHLIRMWLDCPVEETDDRGDHAHRTKTALSRCP